MICNPVSNILPGEYELWPSKLREQTHKSENIGFLMWPYSWNQIDM